MQLVPADFVFYQSIVSNFALHKPLSSSILDVKQHWMIHKPVKHQSKVQLNGNLRDKDNLSTKDKCLTPSVSIVRRFHCIYMYVCVRLCK